MARVSYGLTLRTANADGSFVMSNSGQSSAAVEAAIAVLEADGASPTQGHVTALRAVWTTLQTPDAVLDINNSNLTTQNRVRAALREFERTIAGSGLATG